jgi:hypothetical protein
MAINYTSLLGLAQPVTGTEAGAWGTVVNTQITALVEEAIASTVSLDVTSGDITLTTTVGAANQARRALLLVTGTPGTTRNVIAPSQSKTYVVINSSDSTVVIKGAATTGVSVASTVRALVAWNGSDFAVVASTSIANLTGVLPIANGGTGATTNTAARTNLGATTLGANLFTLANPSAITFPRFNADNTVSALSAADFRTAIGASSGTVTSVSGTGTASGLTLSGTVTTSGSLTLSGTVNSLAAGTYAISISGNAATATTATSATTATTANNVSGVVATANGGTGLSSLTTYALLAGGTTSTGNVQQVSGTGTSGQLLTSNGAGALPTWQDAPSGMVYPGAGIPVSTGSAWTTSKASPSGVIVGTTDTQTLSSKRINPRVVSAASASSLTPDVSAADQYSFTALAVDLTINAPTGTPVDGDKLVFRILDDGTGRLLTWDSVFNPIGVTLPSSTTSNKLLYVGAIYNSSSVKWDVIAVTTQV